jgi:hypothetical protein
MSSEASDQMMALLQELSMLKEADAAFEANLTESERDAYQLRRQRRDDRRLPNKRRRRSKSDLKPNYSSWLICGQTVDVRRQQKSNYLATGHSMIRKLASGQYRLYSRKKNPKTGKRRNLGTFGTRKGAEAHERAVQYFKGR